MTLNLRNFDAAVDRANAQAKKLPKQPRPQPSEFPAMDTRAYLLGEAEYFADAGCMLVWIGNPQTGSYSAFEAWEPQEGGKKLATISI